MDDPSGSESSPSQDHTESFEYIRPILATFLAEEAHAMREALIRITGFSLLLLDEKPGGLNEKQHQALETIKEAAESLEKVTNDLLEMYQALLYSKLNIEEVDIAQLIQEAESAVREYPIASHKFESTNLQDDIPADLPKVYVDPLLMKRALTKILLEAFWLASFSKADRIKISVRLDDHEIKMSFLIETRDFISFQGDSSPRIFLSRMLAERHGGKVLTHRLEETGAEIILSFPVYQNKSVPHE